MRTATILSWTSHDLIYFFDNRSGFGLDFSLRTLNDIFCNLYCICSSTSKSIIKRFNHRINLEI